VKPDLLVLSGTCDWGFCDAPAVDFRWSAPLGWLPVCADHRPRRVQRRRTKGWRMPEDALYVGRPSKWGNPFQYRTPHGLVRYGPAHLARFGREWDYEGRISADGNRHDMWFSADNIVETHVRYATRAEVVELYRLTLTEPTPGMRMAWPSRAGHFLTVSRDDIVRELRGHDLACWCPLDQPCHADVLLAVANSEDGR
jgi:hypothetical protein